MKKLILKKQKKIEAFETSKIAGKELKIIKGGLSNTDEGYSPSAATGALR